MEKNDKETENNVELEEKPNKIEGMASIKKEEKEDINLYFKKTLRNTLSAFFLSLIYTIVNFIRQKLP